MDTPNQNSPIDPGTNASHNDTLHAVETTAGIVAGSVIVDTALHGAAQAGVPLASGVMQGTAEVVSKGVETPMSVGSVVTLAGKVAYETAKIVIPETVAAAKTFAAETAGVLGRTVAGVVTTADVVAAAQVAAVVLPMAVVGSVVLTTPDPEPVHPINLDPSYGVTHTENMSVQPGDAHEVSIDPGTDPHQPNISMDNSQHDTNAQKISIDPSAHDNHQSSDQNMSIDPGIEGNHQSSDQNMSSIDPGIEGNHQSSDQNMSSIDPGIEGNHQSSDQNMSSIDSNISNDQNNHYDHSN